MKHLSDPHPNSTYSRLMREYDQDELERFNRWRRSILDDVSSFERWRVNGCISSHENDSSSKSREDLDFS